MDINLVICAIEQQYNPDRNLACDDPLVTATDYKLLACIKILLKRIDALEVEVEGAHKLISTLFRNIERLSQ